VAPDETMNVHLLLGIPLHVFGLVSFVAALAFATFGSSLTQPARILWDIDGYRAASFVVRDLVFDDAETIQASATGTVDGGEESLRLHAMLKPLPGSEEELRRRVPVGTSIRVWYNPNASASNIKGERVRVLLHTADLAGTVRRAFWQRFRLACLPILICLPLLAGWTFLVRATLGPPTGTPESLAEVLAAPRMANIYLALAGGIVLVGFVFIGLVAFVL
jgi:hypothetical protein